MLGDETEAALGRILPPHMPAVNLVERARRRVGGALLPRLSRRAVGSQASTRCSRSTSTGRLPARPTARAVAAARGAGRLETSRCSRRGSVQSIGGTCAMRCCAGGVPDFYTPENAVEAFSFLAAYRRNQAWLLEVPPPQPEPRPIDIAARRSASARCRRGRRPDAAHGPADAAAPDRLRPAGHRCGGRRHAQGRRWRRRAGWAIRSRSARCAGTAREVAPSARANEPARRPDADARYGEMLDGVRRAPAARSIARRRHRAQESAARRRARCCHICVAYRRGVRPVITFGNSAPRSPKASAWCCCPR